MPDLERPLSAGFIDTALVGESMNSTLGGLGLTGVGLTPECEADTDSNLIFVDLDIELLRELELEFGESRFSLMFSDFKVSIRSCDEEAALDEL